MQEMYLKILLINIYRNYIREESHNLLCRKIKGIIHSNLKLNIKEIAETLNYHPFYLNEVFKKNEGSTLHKYLMKHRLAKAMELINTTQLSLEEIAALCGFSSQAHFSAAFKSAYHISPGRMRRQT